MPTAVGAVRRLSAAAIAVVSAAASTVALAVPAVATGAGLRRCPSGRFLANAAWLVIATFAPAALGCGPRARARA